MIVKLGARRRWKEQNRPKANKLHRTRLPAINLLILIILLLILLLIIT